MKGAFAVLTAACAVPLVAGCGLVLGVDWDRVAVDGAGAPGGGDGGAFGDAVAGDAGLGIEANLNPDGNPDDPCPPPNTRCLDGCCPDNADPGLPLHIAAGQLNTCAVTTTGQVRCWGTNGNGLLGRGDGVFLTHSNKPLTVSRIPRGATAVSIGDAHACAIVQGALACWGSNQSGELGVGSTSPSSVPQKVSLPAPASAVSAGRSFTCAVAGGAAFCWGSNEYFTLAEEADPQVTVPRAIKQLASGVVAVVASQEHACAAGSGDVSCWGMNNANCLGSSVQMTGTPQQVDGTTNASALALGSTHSCALVGDKAMCWGDNVFGELGDDAVQVSTPTPVVPTGMASGVTSICAGFDFTCAVVGGGVLCMGDNSKGQLGDGSGVQFRRVPVAPQGLSSGVSEVACGYLHACALMTNGAVKCWGMNDQGQLGTSSDAASTTPVSVTWP